MSSDKLGVVERWLNAVNDHDPDALGARSCADIEVAGPRGSGFGRPLVVEWLERAGLTMQARRWFCGPDGTVVVEQDATWRDVDTGTPTSAARIASYFEVTGDKVACFARFDDLDTALGAAGLHHTDEVATR